MKYLLLFLPYLLSLLFLSEPKVSFAIAWAGSFYIFYLTLAGKIKILPKDLPISAQLMRPIFFTQVIFAGFMACTSIFYFLDVLGYENFQEVYSSYVVDEEELKLTAFCQRLYCLGHAAMATGILIKMAPPSKSPYYIEKSEISTFVMYFALIAYPASLIFLSIKGLTQFHRQFKDLSFIAATLALALAIPLRKFWQFFLSTLVYAFNFYHAVISGYKEPILISIMVLGIFLYPSYKKIVVGVMAPLLLILILLLPTYARVFRENAWSGDTDADNASSIALDAVLNAGDSRDNTNWEFFTHRLSEISLFTKYVDTTPYINDFYNFQILKQSIIVLVPRILWPSKPITEHMVMERAYNAGIVDRDAAVSAKPQFIVDGYLSIGVLGVFISCLLYGMIAQGLSSEAERLFGSYLVGSALIYSGLYQLMWRGLCYEFLINNIFWSYISMLILFVVLRHLKIIKINMHH